MATKLSLSDTLPLLHSKHRIPRLGFGVYLSHGESCISACSTALEAGYRHIDSAQYYANESEVRLSIQRSSIPRSSLFLTTKIISPARTLAETYASLLESVKKLDGEDGYVDLFLIHTASGGAEARKELWMALERLRKEGKARSIGVSNWGVGHIEEMRGYATVWPPSVNQIELHPFSQQREIVTYCQKHNIVIEAYCPLVRNQKANHPVLKEIAEKHGKTVGHVLIRYCLQKNWIPLPKSETKERIEANRDVYDFELSEDEMERLDGLDEGSKGAIVQAVTNEL